jgi:hypothetical protein
MSSGSACQGWSAIVGQIRNALALRAAGLRPVVAIECYVGVDEGEIKSALKSGFDNALWINTRDAFLDATAIEKLVAPNLGGEDPLFGYLCRLELEQFLSPEKVATLRSQIVAAHQPAFLIGPGAMLIAPKGSLVVYADLARWEAQRRQRQGQFANLGTDNRGQRASLQYKRAYFIDWRVCDRLKQRTIASWDFLLDTNAPNDPKLVARDAFRRALAHCVTRPFRVVPCFDPGPWGGQWMKEVFDLDRDQPNFAWCFDCVPEENSLLLNFGSVRVEVPANDLVFAQPRALLGEPVYGRFGPEFPIRFDLLDTMGGGNLSLQVHPLITYAQERFGLNYTQDESYYLLDANPDAVVYLTRKRGTSFPEMISALEAAQSGGPPFDDSRFIARFPARKHDHFLIPAGTLHGSGANNVVLEISATPYLFTFKLWDWNRMGLDGRPRPINISRGSANILWERDEDYARRRLINQVRDVDRGEGWREERTGLHEAQFIETRRHWFDASTPHDTGGEMDGSVNVLNLVQGEEAIVESPEGVFSPFVVHYAETFIVPAAVGAYRISPSGADPDRELATIKAFVRCRG